MTKARLLRVLYGAIMAGGDLRAVHAIVAGEMNQDLRRERRERIRRAARRGHHPRGLP